MKQIKEEIECKCIKEGYVKQNSVKILFRSPGQISTSHFNGNIMYNLKLQIEVCNPVEGDIIDVTVKNINKMGILGESGEGDIPPISVLLAKQHHIDNQVFDSLKINSKIKVKIIGKRFEYGDNQINIIGVLQNQDSGFEYIPEDTNDDSPTESNTKPDVLNVELKNSLLNNDVNIENNTDPITPVKPVDLSNVSPETKEELNLSLDTPSAEIGDIGELKLDTIDLGKSSADGLDTLEQLELKPAEGNNLDIDFDNLAEVDLHL